jgi:hypothetical protein
VRDVEVAASARAQLSGKKPHEGKSRPLAEAEGTKQLLLGVFEGGADRIHRIKSHMHLAKGVDGALEGTAACGFGQPNSLDAFVGGTRSGLLWGPLALLQIILYGTALYHNCADQCDIEAA